MRRIRIDLAYDGTDFLGWQSQSRGRTVQDVVEKVLGGLVGEERLPLRGAGRTDAGAHAWGQVADCKIDSSMQDPDLAYALRRLLPADVRPLALRTVPEHFHARKDAVSKTYLYRVDTSSHGDPFSARYAVHHPQRLDRESIEQALLALPGLRDWSGFTSSSCDKDDRLRDLQQAQMIRVSEHESQFLFTGSGFLRYMVRNMVGTLLEIGRGRFAPERIDQILSSGDRNLAGPTAASRGLHLLRVRYPGDSGALNPDRLWAPVLHGPFGEGG